MQTIRNLHRRKGAAATSTTTFHSAEKMRSNLSRDKVAVKGEEVPSSHVRTNSSSEILGTFYISHNLSHTCLFPFYCSTVLKGSRKHFASTLHEFGWNPVALPPPPFSQGEVDLFKVSLHQALKLWRRRRGGGGGEGISAAIRQAKAEPLLQLTL